MNWTCHQIHLQQTGFSLIPILTELGIDGPPACHEHHDIPSNEVLLSDPNGEPFQAKWSYRSIIGKLNFLAQNTCPDIAYTVHQCAKYCADPKLSHQIAVKCIGCYLKNTADKGLILCSDGTHQLNLQGAGQESLPTCTTPTTPELVVWSPTVVARSIGLVNWKPRLCLAHAKQNILLYQWVVDR